MTMTTKNHTGEIHPARRLALATRRHHEALTEFLNDRASGTKWLRRVAARAELHAAMTAHPAGKGRRRG